MLRNSNNVEFPLWLTGLDVNIEESSVLFLIPVDPCIGWTHTSIIGVAPAAKH